MFITLSCHLFVYFLWLSIKVYAHHQQICRYRWVALLHVYTIIWSYLSRVCIFFFLNKNVEVWKLQQIMYLTLMQKHYNTHIVSWIKKFHWLLLNYLDLNRLNRNLFKWSMFSLLRDWTAHFIFLNLFKFIRAVFNVNKITKYRLVKKYWINFYWLKIWDITAKMYHSKNYSKANVILRTQFLC